MVVGGVQLYQVANTAQLREAREIVPRNVNILEVLELLDAFEASELVVWDA